MQQRVSFGPTKRPNDPTDNSSHGNSPGTKLSIVMRPQDREFSAVRIENLESAQLFEFFRECRVTSGALQNLIQDQVGQCETIALNLALQSVRVRVVSSGAGS
jgi:hypothetical protein